MRLNFQRNPFGGGRFADNSDFVEYLEKIFRVHIPTTNKNEKTNTRFFDLEADTNDYYCLYTCLSIKTNRVWLSNVLGPQDDTLLEVI